MRRYVNTVDIDQVTVGAQSGAALTTGSGNVLLGPSAGAALTTGEKNVIVGGYTAADKVGLTRNVVLSNGEGTRCFQWDPTTSLTLNVGTTATTPDPTVDGYAALSFDPATKTMVTAVRNAGTVYKSATATKASIDALGVTAGDTLKVGGTDAATLLSKVNGTQLTTSGQGTSLVRDAATLKLRGLAPGQTGVVVADAGDTVTIATTFGAATGGPGNAQSLVADAANMKVRTLSAGTGVNINSTAGNLEIVNTAPNTDVTLQTLGTVAANTADLVGTGAGPGLKVRRLVGGAGVTLTSDANTVTVAGGVTLETEPGTDTNAASLVGTISSGATVRTKRLIGGPGISVTTNGTSVTVENTQTSAGVTLVNEGPAGSISLVSDGTGPSLGTRGLVQGTGITIVEDVANKSVTINNAAPNTAVRLASAGTGANGVDVVTAGTGPNLEVRRLQAGSGMSVALSSTTSVALANARPVAVAVRPSDVVATLGQMSVVPLGADLTPYNWPAETSNMLPLRLQAVRYASSGGAVSHSGALTCALHGLPGDATTTFGFALEVTAYCPISMPAITFNVMLVLPAPDGTITTTWSAVTLSGSLAFPASTGTNGTAPPRTVAVTGLTGGTTRTCLDGQTRPVFPLLTGETVLPSPLPVFVRLSTTTTALASNIDILGMRLTLYP